MAYKKRKKQQISKIDQITAILNKRDLPKDEFLDLLMNSETFFETPELELELLFSNGYPIEITDEIVKLKTKYTNFNDDTFCIVDIETTAGNPKDGQIIEIGALKVRSGKIIDEYESLVSCSGVPEHIQRLTTISDKMLEGAPSLQSVLEEFKIFLDDSVFVAHDIKFDYKFISESLEKFDLGKLENRKLCTIDLAKRTIDTHRYGLEHLKDLLEIDIDQHHRAMSDAKSTLEVLYKSFKNLPNTIETTEDLIKFSKSHNVINK